MFAICACPGVATATAPYIGLGWLLHTGPPAELSTTQVGHPSTKNSPAPLSWQPRAWAPELQAGCTGAQDGHAHTHCLCERVSWGTGPPRVRPQPSMQACLFQGHRIRTSSGTLKVTLLPVPPWGRTDQTVTDPVTSLWARHGPQGRRNTGGGLRLSCQRSVDTANSEQTG